MAIIDTGTLLRQEKVTLLVNTCDAYQDIWPMFFHALEEYWPERTCSIVLNTETKNIDFHVEGLIVHNFVDASKHDKWGLRLIKSLQSINSEYVIVAYDDFIIESKFDERKLSDLIEFMDSNRDVAVCYLIASGLLTVPDKKYNEQERIANKADYRLNSAPALWRREDLIRYTGPNDTPWAWEVFGTYRTFGDGKLFYTPVDAKNDIYIYNYKKGGAIYRGKWVPEVVVSKKKKYDLDVDFTLRGFASENVNEKRTLMWKLKFILLGFKMVGLKALYFFLYYLKAKMSFLK